MARCKAYEIEGPNPANTSSAVRWHRDAGGKVQVDEKSLPICKRHRGEAWYLFIRIIRDGWLYAVNVDAKQ